MLRTSFIAMYKNLGVWAWPAFGRLLSTHMIQQSSFQSLATLSVFATGFMKRKQRKTKSQKRWKRRRRLKQGVDERSKKRRKMRTENHETLIFYLTKRSVSFNLFHFDIFALAFMFSLNELMLRTFFIAMYKNLDVWTWSIFDRLLSTHMIQQSNFQSLITFSRFQDTSKNDVVVKKTKKRRQLNRFDDVAKFEECTSC